MGDLFGSSHPPVDRLARKVVEALLTLSPCPTCPRLKPSTEHGRIHRAGQNGIDADVIGRKFDCHGTGQGKKSAFGCGIGGNIGGGLNRMDRGDIHDARAAARFEQGMRQFDAEKDRAQIGIHDRVPFFDGGLDQRLGNLQGGIVDQRIQRISKGMSLFEDGLASLRDGKCRLG